VRHSTEHDAIAAHLGGAHAQVVDELRHVIDAHARLLLGLQEGDIDVGPARRSTREHLDGLGGPRGHLSRRRVDQRGGDRGATTGGEQRDQRDGSIRHPCSPSKRSAKPIRIAGTRSRAQLLSNPWRVRAARVCQRE